ncbi:MAG: hypothetical protein COA78_13350 [Blastopirellula sp.]|nr:MAG: hypothetical protein COA78_13350 [Blastopirellula sp.]
MLLPETSDYPSQIAQLIESAAVCPLTPGKPNQEAKAQLSSLTPDMVFEGHSLCDLEMANSCISGLWLLHNYLDDSHTISQDNHSSTGSYWHGIMHRREPDYSNAKYWFRKVGQHSAMADVQLAAANIAKSAKLDADTQFLADNSTWDAFTMVDACQAANSGNENAATILRQVAGAEWRILFNYCFRKAIGQ